MNNFVTNAIKRANLSIGLMYAVLVAITLAVMAWGFSAFVQEWRGPQPMSAATLVALPMGAMTSDLKQLNVSIAGQGLIDTGIEVITVRKKRGTERSRSVTGHYYALEVNGRLLLVQSGTSAPLKAANGSATVGGWLRDATASESSDIIARQFAADPKMKEILFSQLVLDTTDDGTFTYLVALGALVALVVGLYNAINAWRRQQNIALYPAIAKLPEKLRQNLDGLLRQLDATLDKGNKLSGQIYINGTAKKAWAMQKSATKVELIALDHLVWAYNEVTKQKLWLVIPLGSTYKLIAHTDDGRSFGWPMPKNKGSTAEATAEEVMAALYTGAPAALYGFTDELKTAWAKERASVVALVAERRAKLGTTFG